MAELFEPTIDDEILEVERELNMRRIVYPRQVSAGKLTEDEALRRVMLLEAVLRRLEAIRDGG